MDSAKAVRSLAVASLAANVGIVVTGGAVRLTGSGLGCPTWPRCTPESFTPHGELGVHGAIEFGNRMVTFVVVAVAVAMWLAVRAHRPRRRGLLALATAQVLGVPAQALLGGLTVLTDLNPWVVSAHFMLSMALIVVVTALVRRTWADDVRGPVAVPPVARRLVAVVALLTVLVLYAGTVVTGSGPHAGDALAPRNGLDPRLVSQVHAGLVYVLVAATVALVVALHRGAVAGEVRRAAWTVLAVELAQGAVGVVQYRLDLPEVLVGLHLFGAALLAAAVTWLALAYAAPAAGAAGRSRSVDAWRDRAAAPR